MTAATTVRTTARRAVQFVDRILGTDVSVRIHHYSRRLHRPSYVFSSDQVAFMRLPKTGGTTLARLLQERDLSKRVYRRSHFPVSRLCPPQRFRYLTIVRDPCERVWSHYQFVLRRAPLDPYAIFLGKGLEYFVRHSWEARDMMTGYFAACPRRPIDARTYDTARRNLDAFFFIARFEDLEHDLRALFAALELPTDNLVLPHLNAGPKSPLTPADREIIARYNRHDLDLHAHFLVRRAADL